MKLFKSFLHDQLFFIAIYCISFFLIIGYYRLTVKDAELFYPCSLAFFFFFLYLLVRGVFYCRHQKNIEHLRNNVQKSRSPFLEYELAYQALNEVHTKYHNEISELKKQATEEKRLLSAFIHNLKTPVTVSDLILQRLMEQQKNENEDKGSLNQALFDLHTENERMNKTLSILLDLQRLSEFSNDYQPFAVSLSGELTRVINENKSLFIQNHVFPKLAETEAVVYTDPKWNGILLNQIISNAVKYSCTEEPKNLYFSSVTEGENCKLMIQDEGIGIPEYDLPKIFDAFFTGENGRKGYSSSGIGLYLCKQICDRLGMKIELSNHEGCLVTVTYLSKL